ncbi:hypothetical protein BD410DRAFT_808318 [Rickenella mellea]|uniref:Uncharacterized protein n=1 Tax=Rickenella mellea TaxID=50990 RepID=A0A4Y7PL59_9AGAM|nr:hypothetical protein BD410DRAFT_808318 [Rickenella mellea]
MARSAPASPNVLSSHVGRPGTPHPGILHKNDTPKADEECLDLGNNFSNLFILGNQSLEEISAHSSTNCALPIEFSIPRGRAPAIFPPFEHTPPHGYEYGLPFRYHGQWYINVYRQFGYSIHHIVLYQNRWYVGGTADPFETANLLGGWVYPFPIDNNPASYHIGENAHAGPTPGYPPADLLRFGVNPPSILDITLLVYALEMERNMFRNWVQEAELEIRLLRGFRPSHHAAQENWFRHDGDRTRFLHHLSMCLDSLAQASLPQWNIAQQYALYESIMRGDYYPTRRRASGRF